MNRSDPRLVKRLRVFVSASAVFSVVVGLSGLLGWTLHIASLLTWRAAPLTMKVNTDACFVLMGTSLWLLRRKDHHSFALARKVAANALAAIVSLVGLLSLAQFLIRQDFGIDRFLTPVAPALEPAGVHPGLMSPLTAAPFLLLGLALLGIDWRTRQGRWPAQFLALSAAAGATFGLFGFAFEPFIYAAHLHESLPTAFTMLVFSLGLVCARTRSGLGALLCSQSLGGSLARRLLPAALIPVLVGWARWQISKTGLYSEWTIVVLSSLTTMSLLVATIAWAAGVVDRNDMERRKVEEALQVIGRQFDGSTRARAQVDALNASLEQRVEHRTAALQAEISGRKQAEEARERMAAVVDSTDDAIISKNLEGTITAWNSGAENLFGYSSFQAVGMPMRLLLPPGSAQEEAEILSGIGRGEPFYHFDAVRVRNDGRNIDVSMTISPIKDSGGAIVGVSNIARDITGRKQAESALAAQAKELVRFDLALQSQTVLLQCVLDSIGEGLAAADEHGQLFLWNPAAEKIIGMGMAILPSEEWTEHYGLYVPGTMTPFPVEQIPLARAIQGQANTIAEIFVRNPGRPEGALIETNAQPLRDKNGVLRGGVIAIRDITQRRKAEQSIQQLNEELEERVAQRTAQLNEVNKELETFTYSVAHDLRAPLRHIAGFSGILLEEFGPSMDPGAQRYLERIRQGASKMGQLVDELLSLARVGRQETKMQQVDLNSIVEEVIGILRPDIQGRQVEWKIAELPFVECDATLVKLVFQNLISNALKYSRPRPLAVIEIGQTQEGAFFVRDNGVGFNMKYADKLFGVFQRLHRAEEFEGIGVGLATVQRIIKKHRGSVWVEAELNKGATFYFTLGGPQPVETNTNHSSGA